MDFWLVSAHYYNMKLRKDGTYDRSFDLKRKVVSHFVSVTFDITSYIIRYSLIIYLY